MAVPNRRAAATVLLVVLVDCAAPDDAPPDYEAMFIADRVVTWAITLDEAAWTQLQRDPTTYVQAELDVDGRPYTVGLRLLGDRVGPKRNLRLRFNSFVREQTFHGVKRVNLRSNWGDPSLIREALSLWLLRRAGVPAPRSSMVWVELNGAGALYTLVEQVDKKFLEQRLGDDRGVLYKVERGGNLVWRGEDPALYLDRIYELKTDLVDHDKAELIALIRALNLAALDDLPEVLETRLDLDGWLRALAVNAWLANMDAYPGNADNFYFYADRRGRFRYIPWDLTKSFGDYHGDACGLGTDRLLQLDPMAPTCGGNRPLVDRVLAVPALARRYRAQLAELVDGALHPELASAQARRLHALIAPIVPQDALKNTSDEDFARSLQSGVPDDISASRAPGLLPFIATRDQVVHAALAE